MHHIIRAAPLIMASSSSPLAAAANKNKKYAPAYEPLNARPPTEAELRMQARLETYLAAAGPRPESAAESAHKNAVLAALRALCIDWVRSVVRNVLHASAAEAAAATGELFVSGSHRLGVQDAGADIDAVFVAPRFCTLQHFFQHFKEDYLCGRQNDDDDEVTDVVAVEDAFVPVLSFTFRGVSIDLMFARMPDAFFDRRHRTCADDDGDLLMLMLLLLDDAVLDGLDEHAVRALNGPRTTEVLLRLVGDAALPVFLTVLRCVRGWAKARGLYGNKMGYFGGINCAILVAFVCQLYPTATPAGLLYRFFQRLSAWNWPQPVLLTPLDAPPPSSTEQRPRAVWSPSRCPKDLMPILTPAFPAMNSALSVNAHSFDVICRELRRGLDVVEQILRPPTGGAAGAGWAQLFAPSDFFVRYAHYVVCRIEGGDRGWTGFVESRIRRLVQYPFLEALPLRGRVQLFPNAIQTPAGATCYFLGFDLATTAPDTAEEEEEEDLGAMLRQFRDSLLDPVRGYRGAVVVTKEGGRRMDCVAEHLPWKRLPNEVFASLGGAAAAAQLRRRRQEEEKEKEEHEEEEEEEEEATAAATNKRARTDREAAPP